MVDDPSPLHNYELENTFTLRGNLARMLLVHAKARQRDPCELLADLVEIILSEDLVDAILDDQEKTR
jgi:hypothetical protein